MSGTVNPSLVSSELTTIETFKDTTEKRGSKLTLNELNYISDKQLHAKGGSGEDILSEFPVIIELDTRNATVPGDISNLHAQYLKGGYSEIRECPIDGDHFLALIKTLYADVAPDISDIQIIDENGLLFSNIPIPNVIMLFNPDGTITFQVVQGDQNQ